MLGLSKKAQEEGAIIAPEEKENATSIICHSDCKYSQNPERQCMLKSVALMMDRPNVFACGQYSPVQIQDTEQGTEGELGEDQSQKQLGLSGAKTKQ